MRFKIASQTLACFALIAMSNVAYSAGYSPVLARLLSGGSNPGPTQPFSFAAQGVQTGASGVLTQAGSDLLNDGDTFESVLAFEDLRNPDGTNAGSDVLGGPGYAAILWSGVAAGVSSPGGGFFFGNIGQFADGDVGNLKQRIVGLGLTDGAFAAVVTSETYDFAGQSWDQIQAEITANNSVDVMGAFDLQAASNVTANATGIGLQVAYNSTNFILDVQETTVPAEMSWWQVSPSAEERVGDGGQLVVQANPSVGFLAVDNYATSGAGTTLALTGDQFALMNPVPEPSSLLAIAGCVGVAGFARRRRARK